MVGAGDCVEIKMSSAAGTLSKHRVCRYGKPWNLLKQEVEETAEPLPAGLLLPLSPSCTKRQPIARKLEGVMFKCAVIIFIKSIPMGEEGVGGGSSHGADSYLRDDSKCNNELLYSRHIRPVSSSSYELC